MIEIKLTPVELAAVLRALRDTMGSGDRMVGLFQTLHGMSAAIRGETRMREALDAYKGKS